jgi:hypothetical protein
MDAVSLELRFLPAELPVNKRYGNADGPTKKSVQQHTITAQFSYLRALIHHEIGIILRIQFTLCFQPIANRTLLSRGEPPFALPELLQFLETVVPCYARG